MVVLETPETEERVARTQKRIRICNRRILYTFTVTKKMLPPWEGCSQSPQKLLTIWHKAVVAKLQCSSPPRHLPHHFPQPHQHPIQLRALPFQSTRKTSRAEGPLPEKGIRSSHAPPQEKVPGNGTSTTYLAPGSSLHWCSLARTARQEPRVQKLPLL